MPVMVPLQVHRHAHIPNGVYYVLPQGTAGLTPHGATVALGPGVHVSVADLRTDAEILSEDSLAAFYRDYLAEPQP
jgi:hypothetical protein